MRKVTHAQFWEMLSYAYRRIAYEAHMKRFVPTKGAFWANSKKNRYQAIDDIAKAIVKEWSEKGIFCVCGHTDTFHKMPGGVWGFGCGWKDCECKKFKSDVVVPTVPEEDKPIMNGNKLVTVHKYPPGKIYDPVSDSFVDDPYERQ